MLSRYREIIYQIFSDEPITPNDATKKLVPSFKTTKDVLMRLVMTNKDAQYKSSGRIVFSGG